MLKGETDAMYIETLYDRIEEEYDHELAEKPEYKKLSEECRRIFEELGGKTRQIHGNRCIPTGVRNGVNGVRPSALPRLRYARFRLQSALLKERIYTRITGICG